MATDNDPPLGWLIAHRSRVQELACGLLELAQKYQHRISGDQDTEDIAALFIGTAFSLWRAVFLAPNDPTSRADITEKGSAFLEKFLRDNNISYGDEKRNREWSFGYYLNNARFRLYHARKIRTGTDVWGEEYAWLTDPRGADENIEDEWKKHIDCFEEELTKFSERLGAVAR
jgi:hypothetical protein